MSDKDRKNVEKIIEYCQIMEDDIADSEISMSI